MDHAACAQEQARLEAEALLGAFVREVKSVRLAGPPRYRPMNQLRSLDVLPLRIT